MGVFPLFFRLLDGVEAPLIVAHRVIWSFIFVGLVLKLKGSMKEVKTSLKDKRVVIITFLSASLLGVNWLIFIWAVENNKVLDVSLGYFINPLVNVALGMILLGERHNYWQWLAIIIAIIAMIIQSMGLGSFPFVAISLALLFGFYGYLRKIAAVGSALGLFIETLLMLPLAIGHLFYSIILSGFGVHLDIVKMNYLIFTGPLNAGALLMFAYAARRLRLTTIGMVQYVAPTLHFLTAIFIFHEELNILRLISFILVWLSLVIFSINSLFNNGTKQMG